jgi:hypothetical protein
MNVLRHPALFTLILLVFVVAILIATPRLGRVARLVPLVVAVPTAVLLAAQLILDLVPRRRTPGRGSEPTGWLRFAGRAKEAADDREALRDAKPAASSAGQLGWALLLPVTIYFLGFLIAVPLHCMIQLRCFSGERWTLSLAVPAGLCGLFVLIARLIPAIPLWQGWIWMRLELL